MGGVDRLRRPRGIEVNPLAHIYLGPDMQNQFTRRRGYKSHRRTRGQAHRPAQSQIKRRVLATRAFHILKYLEGRLKTHISITGDHMVVDPLAQPQRHFPGIAFVAAQCPRQFLDAQIFDLYIKR